MPPKRKLPPTAEAPPSQPQGLSSSSSSSSTARRTSRKTPVPVSLSESGQGDFTGTVRPFGLVAPEITYHVPQQQQQQQQQQLLQKKPSSTTTTTTTIANAPQPRADRNIDKVVLGNLCFRTWYSSQYGKEVFDHNNNNNNSHNNNNTNSNNVNNSNSNTQATTSSSKREPQRMLERLYVCPCCFKYARELVAWRGHVRLCERRRHVPGSKIYVHPRTRRRREEGKDSVVKRRRAESCADQLARSEGEWSIWEVDGDKDGNLSLFAKLFLDNKSVFFDVSGFNYFLLVYTPPPQSPTGAEAGPPPQVTGFFSKEKLSWDSNNLACILIFPPWQRKGLGSLLMGASYEISRREGVIGGPEKPISDLGRKGYRRYWASEIARWLLAVDVGSGGVVITMEDVSRATWIAAEDCLVVLREMGVVEDGGGGGGVDGVPLSNAPAEEAASSKPVVTSTTAAEGDSSSELSDYEDYYDRQQKLRQKQQQQQQEEEVRKRRRQQQDKGADAGRRVRLDKEAVRRFVTAQGISLDRVCDARGFVDGYQPGGW
ncbi:hypothetical protein CP533_5677 [Ophiocordyceps camponoti-saundersi (nom. inval.)]|nr:hypothetical protein CP533_5677 [Ophiocordyceps camponoti-saundersi (nom. inval.)]